MYSNCALLYTVADKTYSTWCDKHKCRCNREKYKCKWCKSYKEVIERLKEKEHSGEKVVW